MRAYYLAKTALGPKPQSLLQFSQFHLCFSKWSRTTSSFCASSVRTVAINKNTFLLPFDFRNNKV
jgi:hypothetical protein